MLTEPQFIGEEVEVEFEHPPLLEKKPGCPDRFTWHEQEFAVKRMVKEWHDYKRRGRMARNMSPVHSSIAEQRGSWGVGRSYFRIITANDRIFELYYDRSPKDASRRKGAWFLFRELPWDSIT